MFIPLSPDFHGLEVRTKTPTVNLILIVVTCLTSFFLLDSLATSDGQLHWAVLQRGNDSSLVQLITHAFLHIGFWHLLGNMICVFAFGNALNMYLGNLRYLALYLGLCMAGALSWLFLGSGPAAIGASGVAMGLGGLFFFLFPRLPMNVFVWALGWVLLAVVLGWQLAVGENGLTLFVIMGTWAAFTAWNMWSTISSGDRPAEGYLLRLLGFRTIKLAGCWILPVFVAQDVVALLAEHADGVAHWAHIGGAAAGIALGLGLTGYGLVRGSHGLPTLLEWIGLQETPRPPRPAFTPPQPRRRRTESARFVRATAKRQLSFSDWQRQRLEER